MADWQEKQETTTTDSQEYIFVYQGGIMEISVNDIYLDVWEDGATAWFHIKRYDSEIAFTIQEAPAVSDALKNLIEHRKLIDNK